MPLNHIRTTALVAIAGFVMAGCVPAPIAEQAYAEGASVPVNAKPSEAVAAPATVPTRGGDDGAYAVASEADFQQIISDTSKPVLVYFTAAWCGPCRFTRPVIDELAQEQAERVRVVTVEPDRLPLATVHSEVRSLPTTVFFKDGRAADRVIGATPKRTLESFLNRNLAP